MVDDRYGWLDEDVAERLLRGEPLDFADGSGRRGRTRWSPEDRAAAERLAAVLARVADSGRPGENGRVPGEQAALAAFRAAQESSSRASAAEFAAESPFGGRRRERHRSGVVERLRSLRLSVVGAVAACALGGVAVASSAGVLPAPSFIPDTGGNRSPSVGATSSAEPPGGTQGKDGSAEEDGKGAGKDGKGGDSGKDGKDAKGEDGRVGTDPDLTGRGVIGDVNGNEPPGDPDQDAVLDELCRDYLAAQAGTGPTPGQGRLQVLEQAAGGPEAVAAYCSNRLGTSVGTPGGVTGGGTGGTGGSTGGDTEEPTSPSPTDPSSPGPDPGGSSGSSGSGGGDTDGGSDTGGGDDDGAEGSPSANPSVDVSQAPEDDVPDPAETTSVPDPEESGSATD